MVSMNKYEYDELEIMGRERNEFMDKYHWANRKVRAQERDLSSVKKRLREVEALVDNERRNIKKMKIEKEEREAEFNRLKNVEKMWIKEQIEKLMKEIRRNANSDDKEGSSNFVDPGEALRKGCVVMYYKIHAMRAARRIDREEVLRYSNLMKYYVTSKYAIKNKCVAREGRDMKVETKPKDRPGFKEKNIEQVLEAWRKELSKYKHRWNPTTGVYR